MESKEPENQNTGSENQDIIGLITKPWVRADGPTITIYYLGELKVFPKKVELAVGQTVTFEVKGDFTASVTLPEGVMIEGQDPQPGIGPQTFEVAAEPREFTVADKPIVMDYFVSAKLEDGRIEGIRRPPMMIIVKKADS